MYNPSHNPAIKPTAQKIPYISHISEFDIDNSFTLKPMTDLMESNWTLYTHVESIYEFFFVSRLNEFGATLLILLSPSLREYRYDGIDVVELVDLLSLCTYQEVLSLDEFSLELVFMVYFLQVHTNTEHLIVTLRDMDLFKYYQG